MNAHMNPEPVGFSLPPSVVEFRDLARRIVRDELVPLEREYLASDRHAYGLPPITLEPDSNFTPGRFLLLPAFA